MTTTQALSPVPPIPGQVPLLPLPEGAVFDLPDRGRLRTVREVAELLGTDRNAVYGLIRDGLLSATKPAGRYRVSIPDLETYVRSTRVLPASETPAGDAAPAEVGEDDNR